MSDKPFYAKTDPPFFPIPPGEDIRDMPYIWEDGILHPQLAKWLEEAERSEKET